MGLLALIGRLPATVEAQLQRDAGLSLFEYLVLAMLSEMPERTVPLKELAVLSGGSLSRLSHVLTRMGSRGLVRRSPSPGSGRVTLATLTDAGWDIVTTVAPGHVTTVRQAVFDRLTADQVSQLGAITAALEAPHRAAD